MTQSPPAPLAPVLLALGMLASASTSACTKRSAEVEVSLELRPTQRLLEQASALSARMTQQVHAGVSPQDPGFDLAPNLGAALAKYCSARHCESLQLLPLFPAGEGLLVKPEVSAAGVPHAFEPVFLRERAQQWELLDHMPQAIESDPRQFSVHGKVQLEPERAGIEVDARIEVLAADQRYLLFDFFDEVQDQVEVANLRIESQGQALRFTRQGALLVVELARGTQSAELAFHYSATPRSSRFVESEFVLYEDWLPYLGGQASWDLQVYVPEDFSLGTPSEAVAPAGQGQKRYTLHADALDRYPIVGSSRPYATTSFEHQGTRFEIWLRPEHAERLSAVRAAVRASMDAFESLGAFPSDRYRILEASYAEGHGALGLGDLMVLGEELLDDKHLLPTVAHELSHAWFAGLLRDPQGRWSEGLASYLSQWPLATERARLMRWGWTVGYEQVPGYRDFALQGDSPPPRADEDLAAAILYGKAALVLQELEGRVGIAKMRQILSLFVYQYRGRSVSWGELQQAVADVSGASEARRFGRWLQSRAAPTWQLRALQTGSHLVRGTLRQQADFDFTGTVMLGTMSEQSEILSLSAVPVHGENTEFSIELPRAARWLVVDPNYTMPRAASVSDKPQWMVRIRGE